MERSGGGADERQVGAVRGDGDGGPLTVALVSSQDGWHGGELHAALVARGLRSRGHRCAILARRRSQFAARLTAEGFQVAEYSGTGRNPLALWQLRRALVRLRPDVLHMNDAHAVTSAGLASLGLRIPARIAMRHLTGPIRSPLRYRAFSDRVIAVANAVAQSCRDSGVPWKMLRVVSCGMDLERLRRGDRAAGRAALGLPEGAIVLLTVAQLSDYKGHAVVLDALPAVLRRSPHAHAVFAGDGELRAALEAQARSLGLAARVHFLGYRDDVPDLIAASDLFVLPSRHTEGLPMVLLEAMLGNCPVVATSAGGIGDLVDTVNAGEGPVAWTVPTGDPSALAAAILDALDAHALRAERVERARRRVLERFTADRMVEGILAVYHEALLRAAPK